MRITGVAAGGGGVWDVGDVGREWASAITSRRQHGQKESPERRSPSCSGHENPLSALVRKAIPTSVLFLIGVPFYL